MKIAFPNGTSLPEGAALLAADVGGTKTDMALFRVHEGHPHIVREHVFASREWTGLPDMIRHFLGDTPAPARIGIAFAGPVLNGKATATNLGWSVDVHQLRAASAIPGIALLNDLEAKAYGLAALSDADLRHVWPGSAPTAGNAAIIAPGTGLGEAGLFWDGQALHPFATEGGHSDFAPRRPFDWALLEHLRKQFGHVSWERLVSGPGIAAIFQFLLRYRQAREPEWLSGQRQHADLAAAISVAAVAGDEICSETLELFVRYLATESASLALKMKATGGLYIGGGIPPKIWNTHLQAVFLEHFLMPDACAPCWKPCRST
ncbi:MAG: ROK family protein [Saprospirales bacterium]|nr:ROK family protein [Saprospirales bacterium]